MDMKLGDTRLIVNVCAANGLLRNQTAYVLATAYHETAHTMKPVRETLAASDKQAISRLEAAWKKGQLKWVKTPYWREGWFGRGYVQLTHKANYELAARKLGIDFVSNPSLVMAPENAAKILVKGSLEGWFTGKKLADYITLHKSDFRGARRIINGTDKAALIAGYAEKYDALLKAYDEEPAIPIAPGKVVKLPPAADPKPVKNGFIAMLLDIIQAIFRRK